MNRLEAVPEARGELHDLELQALLLGISRGRFGHHGRLIRLRHEDGDPIVGRVALRVGVDGADELVVQALSRCVDEDEVLRSANELVMV